MLFERQRVLLTLLDAMGGQSEPIDFHKLLFLYTRQEAEPSYEFVPSHTGCFSFSSDADKRRLIEQGLLESDTHRWQLTEAGRETARKRAVMPLLINRFSRQHASLRGDELVAEVYRRHPYYATRSETVYQVLTDPLERAHVEEARPPKASAGLVTIGYEGKCLESYLNQLLQAGVTLLCDVRRNPLSRKYGFSKGALSHACEGMGIEYQHLPELGIASEKRKELNTQADYDALFTEYKQKSLPKQTKALVNIQSWVNQGNCVALTCFEQHPQQCHRHCVAEALERIPGFKFKTKHL